MYFRPDVFVQFGLPFLVLHRQRLGVRYARMERLKWGKSLRPTNNKRMVSTVDSSGKEKIVLGSVSFHRGLRWADRARVVIIGALSAKLCPWTAEKA